MIELLDVSGGIGSLPLIGGFFGAFLGGALGFLLGGPVGAAIGFAAGGTAESVFSPAKGAAISQRAKQAEAPRPPGTSAAGAARSAKRRRSFSTVLTGPRGLAPSPTAGKKLLGE